MLPAISKRTEFLISILSKTDASDVIECVGIDKNFSSFFLYKCMLAPSVSFLHILQKYQRLLGFTIDIINYVGNKMIF